MQSAGLTGNADADKSNASPIDVSRLSRFFTKSISSSLHLKLISKPILHGLTMHRVAHWNHPLEIWRVYNKTARESARYIPGLYPSKPSIFICPSIFRSCIHQRNISSPVVPARHVLSSLPRATRSSSIRSKARM
mgnify:FL=1